MSCNAKKKKADAYVLICRFNSWWVGADNVEAVGGPGNAHPHRAHVRWQRAGTDEKIMFI
jgi:hypothetical protein